MVFRERAANLKRGSYYHDSEKSKVEAEFSRRLKNKKFTGVESSTLNVKIINLFAVY